MNYTGVFDGETSSNEVLVPLVFIDQDHDSIVPTKLG